MGKIWLTLTLCLFKRIFTLIAILLGTVHLFHDIGSVALLFKTKLFFLVSSSDRERSFENCWTNDDHGYIYFVKFILFTSVRDNELIRKRHKVFNFAIQFATITKQPTRGATFASVSKQTQYIAPLFVFRSNWKTWHASPFLPTPPPPFLPHLPPCSPGAYVLVSLMFLSFCFSPTQGMLGTPGLRDTSPTLSPLPPA